MKTIVHKVYGSPEKLTIEEVEKPEPKPNEVLVQVKATAVNDYDWSLVSGIPRIYRLMFGLFKPRSQRIGMELSGTVAACGEQVTAFKVADHVYGDTSDFGFGTFAEFISIDQRALVKKPVNISFEEAAGTPHAAMLAIQALKDIAGLNKGQSILVNGAGGGVGSFALQYAKLYEAKVTAVDSKNKLEYMKKIGFDEVIPYEEVDFTKENNKYDIVLDCKTNRNAFRYLKPLKPGGIYVTVGGSLTKLLQILIFGMFSKIFGGKQLRILALKPNKGLKEIEGFLNEGQLKCLVDGPYPFQETAKAITLFGNAKHKGKVIVSL